MILIFGKSGQVAQALKRDLILGQNASIISQIDSSKVTFLSSEEANFLEPDQVLEKLNLLKPKLVINASAYTMVDKAEIEKDLAMKINAITPGIIAQWCDANDARMVHFSTDYVFNGNGSEPWLESMSTDPVNFYGKTKLEGEKKIIQSGVKYYIFRVSWIYAPWGKNFPKTILKLATEREELSIVSDQIGSPTDAREISAFLKLVLNESSSDLVLNPGIYHLRFKPYMSWFEVAEKTVKEALDSGYTLKVKKINPIDSSAFPTPAKRPLNSRLNSEHLELKGYIEQVQKISTLEGWGYLK